MQRYVLKSLHKSWITTGSQHFSRTTAFDSSGLSRSFCQRGESSEGKSKSLKSQLRLLYKKIHPDLFHNQPNFRGTNEKSFQVLQEYLASAQNGSVLYDGAPPQMYRFEFYIRQNSADSVDADTASVEKVDVVLPPPQRARSSGGELPVATRMAIGRLLEACGLSGIVSGGLSGQQNVSLTDLFQQASELQRVYASGFMNAERHAIVVRNALRMGRGVFASFREPLAEASASRQVAALERLIRSLDVVPHLNLAGCTMVVGRGYGVDALGNIWLDCQDEPEAWAHWLAHADIQGAHDRRLAARERQGMEVLTASDMEVEMLYTDNLIGVTQEYADFLKRMSEGAQENGGVGAGAYLDLPVRVVGSSHEEREDHVESEAGIREGNDAKVDLVSPYHVNEDMGYVTVPVSATHANVCDFIYKRGGEALKFRKRYRNEEQRLKDMKAHVRQKLRLRNLACDDKISSDQFMSSCARMLRHAPELQMHMEGLYVCISDDHRLPGGTDMMPIVHLKWNFTLEEL